MRFLLTLGLLASFSPCIQAADDKVRTIPVSIYCFRYAPQLDTVYLRSSGTDFSKVELSTANIVGPQNAVVENSEVTVHRQVVDAEGKPTWPAVARVKVPADCPRALLLLIPSAPEETLPYRGIAFPHTIQDFPIGSMKMVNLSPFPVRGAIGPNIVTLAPGGVETMKPKGEAGTSMPVLFEFNNEKRWQRMTVTRWTIRDDRRALMCIFRDPATKRMNIRSIPDRTVSATPATP